MFEDEIPFTFAPVHFSSDFLTQRTRKARPSRNAWKATIAMASEKLAELEKFGDDIFEDGSIISFDYQFVVGGKIYSYAAIKCNGLWYSTGPKAPKAFSWDDLCGWWSEAANDVEIWYVKKLEQLNP